MKKIVLITGVLSTLLLADVCSEAEKIQSAKIFADSRDEKIDRRIDLLEKAKKICSLPRIEIEIEKLLLSDMISAELLQGIEDRLTIISNRNDKLESKLYALKINNAREIDKLFKKLYMKQYDLKHTKGFMLNPNEIKNLDKKLADFNQKLDTNDKKSLLKVGGLYKSDLRFNKNKFAIRNKSEANELVAVMKEIVQDNPKAFFTVTGYASSGGTKEHNKILSDNRATSFADFSKLGEHIKIFSKGETSLVCKDGLLPEPDENGEYRCTTSEDKDASRRVQIRRVK